jgi:hypothetical protein
MSTELSDWEIKAKQMLKEGIGIVYYGVRQVFDLEDYELMYILREIMEDIERGSDFFKGFKVDYE